MRSATDSEQGNGEIDGYARKADMPSSQARQWIAGAGKSAGKRSMPYSAGLGYRFPLAHREMKRVPAQRKKPAHSSTVESAKLVKLSRKVVGVHTQKTKQKQGQISIETAKGQRKPPKRRESPRKKQEASKKKIKGKEGFPHICSREAQQMRRFQSTF